MGALSQPKDSDALLFFCLSFSFFCKFSFHSFNFHANILLISCPDSASYICIVFWDFGTNICIISVSWQPRRSYHDERKRRFFTFQKPNLIVITCRNLYNCTSNDDTSKWCKSASFFNEPQTYTTNQEMWNRNLQTHHNIWVYGKYIQANED